jgi:predicted heme/steroid binding protein
MSEQTFTLEELAKFDGKNSDKKIYIGVKGGLKISIQQKLFMMFP